ncbi:MAG: 5-(carboxyamino)imidazole ribonucleotide synthase [Alphaproteobacteria bacterium]|jgi:5-(carboxyamino)imidazole ribonucleotide synthase|nr:5-(carboxyamino)imidazole ribonucleotide synthase [Alphaproteobacteria bacterium]MDP7222829.1 5-(carboxyamino)imidazole ribonucleotide synthase [Alphaproteobacteria bacterium]
MIYPPKKLGILGGGQLGRMSAIAAARLGIETHIFTPEENAPASHVATRTWVASYDDKKTLKAFCEQVDVVSYEFENIPVDTIREIQKTTPVYPDDRLLEVTQHRITEKKFLNDIGLPTAKWALATSAKELQEKTNEMGCSEYIIKTTRFGYDGKGQMSFSTGDDSKACWKQLNSKELIIEEKIDFACEISVIVARDKLGQMAVYGPSLNEHKGGILHKSTVPAAIPHETAIAARQKVETLAEAVDLVGVLALELFVGKGGEIFANEIAPRTHNSGHWTIDACTACQFQQHVRTVCGLPVAIPNRHSDAMMVNLLGSDVRKVDPWLEMRGANIHFYGKTDIKDGRKMGHVTVITPKDQQKVSYEDL